MALKIEKNVPLNRKIRASLDGEFHDFLGFCTKANIGDSVVVSKRASNYRMAMLIAKSWLYRSFSASPDGKGLRVWRVT